MKIEDFENKLIESDCFEVMKDIPDKSIDLILTDPPYGLKWKQQIELHGRKAFYHNYEELKEWDKIDKDYYIRLFKEFDRIVKESGSVLIFCKTEFVTWIYEAGLLNNFDYKATINYVKSNPVPQCRKKNYCSSFETICWLARWHEKKCLFTFNFKTQKEMHNFIILPICSGNERIKIDGKSHPCLLPNSKVITIDGVKEIKDINHTDMVLSSDGKFNEVDYISKHHINEPVYKIQVTGTNNDIIATDNHPFLIAIPNKTGKRVNDFTINFIESKNIKIGDYIINTVPLSGTNKINKNKAFLIGLFLADGHFQKAGNGNRFYPVFSLHEKETELIERIKRFSSKTKIYKSKLSKGITVMIFDYKFGKYLLKWCNKMAYTKKLNKRLWKLDNDTKEEILKGYLAGDGNFLRGYHCAKTVSESIAIQIVYLARSLGYRSVYYKNKAPINKGIVNRKFIKTRDFYQIYIYPKAKNNQKIKGEIIFNGSKHFLSRVKKITKINYIGDVINLSIKGDPTFETVIGTSHNTQKSLKLIKHLIEIHSNPGDIILDCFAGTSTTGVASIELGRRYICIENDPNYIQMSKIRIEQSNQSNKQTKLI